MTVNISVPLVVNRQMSQKLPKQMTYWCQVLVSKVVSILYFDFDTRYRKVSIPKIDFDTRYRKVSIPNFDFDTWYQKVSIPDFGIDTHH